MNILKFVLTGGPCAGKTTALEPVAKTLESMGYVPLMVPEAATITKTEGITPQTHGVLEFQRALMLNQLKHEKVALDLAQDFVGRGNKVAIVHDRGLQDSAAYMNQEDFVKLQFQLRITSARSIFSYNAVIHMVTAANGALNYYSLSNNTARDESPEQAVMIDNRLQAVWEEHPNHYVISNEGVFGDKLSRVSQLVKNLVIAFSN